MSQLHPGKAPGHYRLEGELTIYSAAQLKPDLLSVLSGEQSLELDLSGVRELDTAGLQLLLLLKRGAAAEGIALRFVAHSEPVLDVLGLLNVVGELGDPVLIPSRRAESTHES